MLKKGSRFVLILLVNNLCVLIQSLKNTAAYTNYLKVVWVILRRTDLLPLHRALTGGVCYLLVQVKAVVIRHYQQPSSRLCSSSSTLYLGTVDGLSKSEASLSDLLELLDRTDNVSISKMSSSMLMSAIVELMLSQSFSRFV